MRVRKLLGGKRSELKAARDRSEEREELRRENNGLLESVNQIEEKLEGEDELSGIGRRADKDSEEGYEGDETPHQKVQERGQSADKRVVGVESCPIGIHERLKLLGKEGRSM